MSGGVLRIFARAAARLALAIALLSLQLLIGSAQAQIPSGGTIEEIRIEGTQRVEPETVRSYLLVQPGDKFDSDRIDQSLKALFATGLFTDVTLRREGNALIVRVVENAVINRIAFEGNHRITDKSLNDEIQLKPRAVYTREKVQSDVKRIIDLYRRNSRFAATVDPKVIPLEQNRVDLVFEIDEGPSTGIEGINFVGNHDFSANRLRQVVQTKESRWYRFLSSDDIYDPDRLTYDRDLLRKFYLSEGYADFRLVSAVAELAPARDGFIITFTIDEGERYHFGKIDITNQLPTVDPATLKPVLKTKEGDWYNADSVEVDAHGPDRHARQFRLRLRRYPAADQAQRRYAGRSTSPIPSRRGRASMSSASTSSAICARATRSSGASSGSSRAMPSTPRSCTAPSSRSRISTSSPR